MAGKATVEMTAAASGEGCAARADRRPGKLITYAVPCYNSADYMDRCIESILACGADDIEVVVVDDGSAEDDTLAKAQEWESRHPGVVRAVHQENGGHGAAVMKGLELARGMYFKVVDSDDWLDDAANRRLLEVLRAHAGGESDGAGSCEGGETRSDEGGGARGGAGSGESGGTRSRGDVARDAAPLDLVLANYVYEHVADGTSETMDYEGVLPKGRVFRWEEAGHWKLSRYILMHSVVYRTQMLRDYGLDLPRHTFYVDNIFVYAPLPAVHRIYYLDADLYRYYIGRDDQSVNESVMIGRIDQQLRVTRAMIDAYHLHEEVPSLKLRAYMYNYLGMMMLICTVFSMMSEREDKRELRDGVWEYLKAHDERDYEHVLHSPFGRVCHLPGKAGDAALLCGYHVAQKLFKFN